MDCYIVSLFVNETFFKGYNLIEIDFVGEK